MNDALPDPPRWKETTGQARLAERAAGETLRAWGQPQPLPAAVLGRIAGRIRGARRRRLPRLLPVAAALLLGIATAASAAHLNLLPRWLGGDAPRTPRSTAHDSPSVQPSHRSTARAARPWPDPTAPQSPAADDVVAPEPGLSPSAGPTLPAPSTSATARAGFPMRGSSLRRESMATPPVPVPEPSVRMPSLPPRPATLDRAPEPAPATRVAWVPPPEPRPATPVGPAAPKPSAAPPAAVASGQAAQQLAAAIRLLRTEGKAEQALALLDSAAPALRHEGLGHEALILRVESLLVLGRTGQALGLLDGTSLSDVAASHALLVTRGKLRTAAHRCADAVGDFTLVLAEAHGADREALFGRAVCRHQLGDGDGARVDLESYRRAFPDDAKLRELERRLGGAR